MNDTDVHHPLKFSYQEKESLLINDRETARKRRLNSSRDEIMQMLNSSWSDTIA